VALAAGSPAVGQGDVGFPDGDWEGQPLVWRGSLDEGYVFAEAAADVTFELSVEDGKVSSGTMKLSGRSSSVVEGPPPVTVNVNVSGTYGLTGTAADVTMTGSLTMRGTAETQGFQVPIDFTTDPGKSTFSPTFVSCNKVTGDLATRHEQHVRAQGINASIDAAFVALRVSAGPDATEVLAEYDALADLIIALSAPPPKPADLLAVAEKIDSINSKLLGLGACDAAPPGFQKGLQDTTVSALFQDVLNDVLARTDDYSGQELLSLLAVGIRVGAVGLSVPGSPAVKNFAKNLFTQFEAALIGKVDAARAAGDQQTILDVLVTAQQLGMNALADHAQGALAGVQP
jgi:hypothetical protein